MSAMGLSWLSDCQCTLRTMSNFRRLAKIPLTKLITRALKIENEKFLFFVHSSTLNLVVVSSKYMAWKPRTACALTWWPGGVMLFMVHVYIAVFVSSSLLTDLHKSHVDFTTRFSSLADSCTALFFFSNYHGNCLYLKKTPLAEIKFL